MERVQNVKKNKLIAAVIAFFFGGFGFHKFYLGRIGWGVTYLLLCWTFVPIVVSFVETIIFLACKEETFDNWYNNNQ